MVTDPLKERAVQLDERAEELVRRILNNGTMYGSTPLAIEFGKSIERECITASVLVQERHDKATAHACYEKAAQEMCTFCKRGIPIRPTELLGPYTHTAPEGYERCRAIPIRALSAAPSSLTAGREAPVDFGTAEQVITGLDEINKHNAEVAGREAMERHDAEHNRKVEVLKVWYAIFTTIMDMPDTEHLGLQGDMQKLRKLRERLRLEAPELEAELSKEASRP